MLKGTIRQAVLGIAAGSLIAIFISWVAYRLHFNLSSATSVHLFLITAITLRWGFFEASTVSLLSVACLDYFFTEPVFAFSITDSHDWVALITFESVALLVSRLSNRLTRHARDAEIHRFHLQKLYELSQQILLLDYQKAVDQQLTDLIHATFAVQGVTLWDAYELHLSMSGTCNLSYDELRSTHFMESNNGDAAGDSSQRILHSGTRSIGSLIICGHTLDADSLNAIASLTAIAIERARSFNAQSHAEAARQTEQLRSAVLDGLAHAFKTPLTTIRSSSSGLIEMNTLRGTEKRLVILIDQHAGHLNELTTRLLRTARIDSAELRPRRKSIDLNGLIQETLEAFQRELDGHLVNLRTTGQRITVWVDPELLKMALFQLFDNAIKYGTINSSITIDAREEEAEILISITNEGSFVPSEEKEKIFHRFYRSPGNEHKTSGTGIGLSVVKRVTQVHQGRIWVESDPIAGTTFFLTLPKMAKES